MIPNPTRRIGGRTLIALGLLLGSVLPAGGQQDSVVGTLHNLSVSGPGEIRSLDETEVCKFCHVPHNAEAAQPLWGHALSRVQYRMPQTRTGQETLLLQPDGSSRLCLSCHDGTVALGEIVTEARPIRMTGGDRLGPQRRGFLGTDLSGSHPISFIYGEAQTLSGGAEETDMGLKPLGTVRADGEVRLDGEGKMQCTTCHDAHADAYYQPGLVPRFWVKPSLEEVCLVCHALR